MRVHLIASAIVVAALAQGAYAQVSSSSTASQPNAQAGQQNTQSLPTEIKDQLKADGFTDVTVVPGSFLVNAKDKRGHPVVMMIGPNSMTIITAANPPNQSTTGSSTSNSTNNMNKSNTGK